MRLPGQRMATYGRSPCLCVVVALVLVTASHSPLAGPRQRRRNSALHRLPWKHYLATDLNV